MEEKSNVERQQLLDVVVVIGSYEQVDNSGPYVTSKVIRLDVEGLHRDDFIRVIKTAPGVVHSEGLKAANDDDAKALDDALSQKDLS